MYVFSNEKSVVVKGESSQDPPNTANSNISKHPGAEDGQSILPGSGLVVFILQMLQEFELLKLLVASALIVLLAPGTLS